jgi:arginine utilization protein RocB
MKKERAIAALLPLVFLFGCETKEAEPTVTVEWYASHQVERLEKIAECSNNPGELEQTPNCINAKEANKKNAVQTPGLRF